MNENQHLLSDKPCIDPKASAEFEARQKLMENILELLKGKSHSEAKMILDGCTWLINTKAIIQ